MNYERLRYRDTQRVEAPPEVSKSPGTTIAETLQQLIDDLPEQIAILDEECAIIAGNAAWKQAVEEHGHPDAQPGHNYRAFCARKAGEGYEPAIEALSALDDIYSGKRDSWQLTYSGGEAWAGREYQICFHRLRLAERNVVSITRFDLTEVIELRRAKEELTSSLSEERSSERRRIARELHDSTSQLLTAMGLVLGRLNRQLPEVEASGLVGEMQQLLGEIHREIRSFSHLAHPPSLEKLGLGVALASLVEGFGRRSGIETAFRMHGASSTMSRLVEGMIYRIAQEALSNVHRHAHASKVDVQLHHRRSCTHFIVADNGVGIAPEILSGLGRTGVGLASMRSRLSEVGGRLSIRNLSPGTAILVSVPATPLPHPAHVSLSTAPLLLAAHV